MCTGVLVISLLIASVLGCDENQAKIRFYSNSMNNFTELCIEESEKILSTSWYDPTRKTVMFCHGFTGHPKGPAVTAVITAYLSLDKYNVALLNWDKLAALALPGIVNSFTKWAVPNAIQLAGDLSETLLRMSAAGLNLNNTHLVGHSLGAHVLGIAGNQISEKGVQLPCIIALDPAIGIDAKPAFLRLRPSSARVVSVLHSDPSKYGSSKELGFVDFWPNFNGFSGPVLQPGCPRRADRFTEEDFCSHNRAWILFVEEILKPGSVTGTYAKNYRTWKKYTDKERRENVLSIGVCDENVVPGKYFFKTSAEAPYGLGEMGL